VKFAIKHRFSGSVLFEAEINATDDTPLSIKLGLSVKWAISAKADLSYADLRSADLSSADLSYANLSYANLRSADLSYADLSYANLSYANLRYADLRSADLRSADLSYADLSYANLRYANLRYATGVVAERTTDLLLLLDQPGRIRAYKLVNERSEGHINGGIKYVIGESCSVENANTDVTAHCGAGINVATLPWVLREWRPGYRVLIVEFEAADIAAIPTATDGKFRLHRCAVVGEKTIDPVALGLVPRPKADDATPAAPDQKPFEGAAA